MTDKQTSTVVVSRELLEFLREVFLGLPDGFVRRETGVATINAILAAPVEQQSTWESLARKLAWYLSGALEANAPHMTDETMHDALEALDQVRKMPVEQQGEPFCFTTHGMIGIAKAMRTDGATGRIGCKFEASERFCVPLYRHVQPPARIVLPERANARSSDGKLTYESNGWNACLDEIAKLNRWSNIHG